MFLIRFFHPQNWTFLKSQQTSNLSGNKFYLFAPAELILAKLKEHFNEDEPKIPQNSTKKEFSDGIGPADMFRFKKMDMWWILLVNCFYKGDEEELFHLNGACCLGGWSSCCSCCGSDVGVHHRWHRDLFNPHPVCEGVTMLLRGILAVVQKESVVSLTEYFTIYSQMCLNRSVW